MINYESIYFLGFVCFLGLILHFTMKWQEARKAQGPLVPLGPINYIKSVPAQSLGSLVASTLMFLLALSMEWMNPGAAAACGYMGHSMAENMLGKYSPPPQ